MIKGIIFDLDRCILDTYSLTGDFFDPVLRPLYESDLPNGFKLEINEALWSSGLDDVSKRLGVPTKIIAEMREAYRVLNVPNGIRTYGDEAVISSLPTVNILVTTGYKKFQSQKINILNIDHLFEDIIIDELDHPDKRLGKELIFQNLLNHYSWKTDEVLVVGDNPDSELGAGKRLGLTTIQTKREHVIPWDDANYQIQSLTELPDIIKGLKH